ncbi:MAG TPA: hypothetical protein VK849_00340 [Longimicrobiales bacterium]|nr:hypothetical protein [Longimicrobiales bacterium]
MRYRILCSLLAVAATACSDPAGPDATCALGPVLGIPTFDLVGSLRIAGATVEDLGTALDLKTDGPPTRVLRVDGHDMTLLEYGCPAEAAEYVGRFSADASTYEGVPLTWDATPHIYLRAQAVATYQGDDADLLALMRDVMGDPVREGQSPA